VQTKVSVGKEDQGKSISLAVGDLLEVSLGETDGRAAWQVAVDGEILAPVSSPTNTETVWVLDAPDQIHLRTFRAVRVGCATLTMTYTRIEGGAPLDTFTIEAVVGNPPKPKLARQQVPAPQLLVILVELFLGATAAALLSFRLATVAANILQEQADLAQISARINVGQADLLVGLLGTVAMGAAAAYALVRVISMLASRPR